MSLEALDPSTVPETEADQLSDAMKDQLRKDVASWREGRVDGSPHQATELSVAVAKPAPAPRVRRAKPAAAVAEPETAKKKPFGMSYDGSTNADYINYMISRGAR
nr:hypothetical protein [uncultured Rhodopila sp.]